MIDNNEKERAGSRDVIVEALNKTVEIFTSHSEKSFDEVVISGLQPVADAAGLNRIAVYRLLDKESGRIGQIYVWAYGKTVPLDEELVELPNVPPVIRWLDILTKGECVHGNAMDMPRDQADFCAMFGVKSILFVPVFTHGEFWGIITLEDHTVFRYFDEDCLDLLRSAARLCASAFIRNEMTESAGRAIEALKRRETMTDTLNKMAIKFLSRRGESFEEMMNAGIELLAGMAGLDRLSVWRNFKMSDGLHTSQFYRWDRKSGGTTAPTAGLTDVTFAGLAPRWEGLLASGKDINGPVRLMPEAAMLQSFGVVSAFVAPVFINKEFWGFVLFEDRRNERYFDEDIVNMMRSAAFLCVNTVIGAEMEREIIDANEYSRATLSVLPVGFTVFDDNLRLTDCNETILKILETKKEYFLNHFDEFSPEYQPDGKKSSEVVSDVHRRALEGERFAFEWMHRSSSGELIPFEITLARTNYKGRYLVLAYQYDSRNIKKMETNIREQSELLKARLEQQELISEISRGFISSGDSETYVKEAIAKLGRHHNVSRVNIFEIDYQRDMSFPAYQWSAGNSPQSEAADQRSGVDPFAMVKSSFPERLPDWAALPVLFCDDVEESPDDAYRAMLSVNVKAFIIAPLYVEGRLWGILSVEQYFKPRHWTENEQIFVAMTAGTIAGVIMRSIYNTKLKEALDKATVASRAKSDFLSNMSHEIRTPLNAIIGMTGIGKNAEDIEHKDYALHRIEEASTHLLGVINDILDMSKIEANKFELSPSEFNFERMLQQVVNVVCFRMEEKQQRFKVYIDRKIPACLIGDDQRLAQVITNLVGNAVKFTPDGGSISIGTFFMGEENDLCTIQITVKDSGIGISSEQQKILFQSFQQAESSTSRRFGGTGLGLSISRSIVEMMGGRIWVESELGKGSAFTFSVQLKRGEENAHRLNTRGVNWDNVRILVVDDDIDTLAFLRVIMQELGASCDTAVSGEAALELVESYGTYDIYFIDWKLPGIDGIELTGILKGKESDPADVSVIMFSAATWNSIEYRAKEAGVDKFLSKPLFPSAIKDAISECLGNNAEHAEEEPSEDAPVFAGKCILLAEDVEINREIVLTILEPTKLEIDCAENGIIALNKFREAPEKYDMIFMDLQMPEMDGLTAAREIRALDIPKAKTIPIVAMTANVFREDIDQCLEAGMNSHLGKPLNFDEIMEKLRTYMPG